MNPIAVAAAEAARRRGHGDYEASIAGAAAVSTAAPVIEARVRRRFESAVESGCVPDAMERLRMRHDVTVELARELRSAGEDAPVEVRVVLSVAADSARRAAEWQAVTAGDTSR